MGYRAAAEAVLRRRLLEEMYDRMTDEEKRLFAQMTMQQRSNAEILQAIGENRRHLERIAEHQQKERWYTAFGSDVAANVLTTSAFWLLGKLFSGK